MGFSTQEYWSGLPFPSPGDILDPGKPGSPALQVILYCLSHQGNPPEIQQELNVFLLAEGLITEMKGIWDLFSNRIILGSSNRAGLHQCFTGSQDWTLIFSGCLLNEATPRFWVCVSEAALKPINLSRVFWPGELGGWHSSINSKLIVQSGISSLQNIQSQSSAFYSILKKKKIIRSFGTRNRNYIAKGSFLFVIITKAKNSV